MKYENTKCPGCEQLFAENDDVVVCPECGTPQHRQCYENNGGCVNAALHESGFVWKNENMPAAKEDESKPDNEDGEPIICPRCGKENPKGTAVCTHCGQKFTVFGFNIVEKQQQLEREDREERQQRLDAGFDGFSDDDELPPLSKVVDERVKLLAPGISEQQKQEVLCGHTIDKVISFVGYGAQSYINKFRILRDGGKFTFNWAACLLSPFWFFFRKLYKPGIIFSTFQIILLMISTVPMAKFDAIVGGYTFRQILALPAAQQQAISAQLREILPVMILLNLLSVVLAMTAGFIADKLYYRYTEKSLSEIEAAADNTFKLSLLAKYGSTSRWAPIIAIGAVWIIPNLVLLLFGA